MHMTNRENPFSHQKTQDREQADSELDHKVQGKNPDKTMANILWVTVLQFNHKNQRYFHTIHMETQFTDTMKIKNQFSKNLVKANP